MASSVASSVSPWSMSSLRAALPCKSNTTTSCKRDAPCCLQMRTYTTVPKLRSGAVVVSEPRRLLGSSYYGLVRENPLLLVGSVSSFEQKFEGIRTLGIFRAMRHGRRVPKLNRPPDQRNAILRGLTTQVLKHGRVLTTLTRAKATRSHVDKMITLAKDGSLHKRRQVLSFVYDKQTVHSLFAEVQDRYGDRNGGFTRIIRALPRRGDNAPMAYLELV